MMRQDYWGNDKTFFLPNGDIYLMDVLYSALMLWHNRRYLGHMRDDALNPETVKLVTLPVALPTDMICAEVEPAVQQLIALTKDRHAAIRDVLD